MNPVFLMLLGIGSVLAIAKMAVVWFEPRIVFHPVRRLTVKPSDWRIPFREHLVETSDGVRLIAWELPCDDCLGTVVFFHGNSGNLSEWAYHLAQIRRRGFHVAALDYRGYGNSSGSPSEQGVYRDIDAFVRYFQNQMRSEWPRPMLYWGRSLGGPIAAYAATRQKPDGLILESTFPSKDSLLKHSSPLIKLVSPLSRYAFPTLAFLKANPCPALVIHGDDDPVIPIEQGERLFAGLTAPKDFLLLPGADHSNTQSIDPDLYWGRITAFARGLPQRGG